MGDFKGVEIGKMLRTEADVIEHCYPQMHKRLQLLKNVPPPGADPTPPPAPSVSSKPKSKSKKTKTVEEAIEALGDRDAPPATEPEATTPDVEPDPSKEV
jgi:hypothetical protein